MTVYIDIEHNAYGDLLSIQDKTSSSLIASD